MILKFFKTDDKKNVNSELIDVACLMIHAAKIDENYTEKEKKIIRNALIELGADQNDLDKILKDAELKEKIKSNQ